MQIKRKRQGKIGIQVPLMRFVEENRRHTFKTGVGLQATHQQAFGHHFNARAVGKLPIEARRKPNGAAGLVFPQQGSHAARGGTGGNTARFQHQDAPFSGPGFLHQRQRHDGGLTRAGRRDQHSV